MKFDFAGWATKAGLKCKDGKTIAHGAFKGQDKVQVPLVWQHGHSDIENVLGHVVLEDREEGVYAYGYFNDTPKAQHAAMALGHKDVNAMSIWANELVMRADTVLHGIIREVSLVLAGANPGAVIESVTLRHGDGSLTDLEDEVIITTGLTLEHADGDDGGSNDSDDDSSSSNDADDDDEEELTVQDVLDSMTDEQRSATEFLVGQAALAAEQSAAHSQNTDTNETNETPDKDKDDTVKHNVFDKTNDGKGGKKDRHYISHEAMQGIVKKAEQMGSLRDAVADYAGAHLEHGIDDIDILFPDAHAVDTVPQYLQRRTEWVGEFMGMTTKSPFSRIKTLSADITEAEARAKGYITGSLKKEEFFRVNKRVTTPTTVYKKQKLDRDDMVDITDFDVVSWLKAEMRLMLDEEVARAGLVGDGRDIADEDKINEQNIRPIASDHELFVTTVYVNLDDTPETNDPQSMQELMDKLVMNRRFLKGSGLPTMFTTETVISSFLLMRDAMGRDLYTSVEQVATKLRVRKLVAVEVMEEDPEIVAVIVNPVDYTYGATRGGEVNLFDDFDIDYNQYKYLIETRCCGCLTKLKSAIVVRRTDAANVLVSPAAPAFDAEAGELTITDQTGVVYKDGSGTTLNAAGSPYSVTSGESITVVATPAAGYYFETSEDDSWTFTAE